MATEHGRPRDVALARVFTPSAPIDQGSLFAGRRDQLRRVISAVNQRGQHVIIFGERGVGKTSLANVLHEFLGQAGGAVLAPRVSCDSGDTFGSVWRKLLGEIQLVVETRRVGFGAPVDQTITSLSSSLQNQVTPDEVRRLLTLIGQSTIFIVIIDEFDRLPDQECAMFADTIKTLSDSSCPVTLILVGVADTVDDLIEEHASVDRALVQVQMPRMSQEELKLILENGFSTVGMSIKDEATGAITGLSQGLPHYTHLLGLHSGYVANDEGRSDVRVEDVRKAVTRALADAQQSIISAYHKATFSARETLYPQVLLACARARTDSLGFFAAADVREPLSRIMGRRYDIPSFSRHLNDFCEASHGRILQKMGTLRRFRFRFTNPLMQPFVLMSGVSEDKVSLSGLEAPQFT